MKHKVTITALAKYLDIFTYFRKELDKVVSSEIRKIVVCDGYPIKEAPGWEIIRGPGNFTMSGNHNVAWRAVEPDSDILNMNDDVYFLEPDAVAHLQSLVYSEPRIGCVSAYVKIGFFGNPIQCRPRQDVPISFVKTSSNGGGLYVRREALDEVGYFGESFNEKYGAEDADWTYRMNLAGWKVGIARDVPIKHGFRNGRSTSTSLRAMDRATLIESNKEGVARFEAKHGGPFKEKVHGFWDWDAEQS
jgi:GT2 family glycosyltransferase